MSGLKWPTAKRGIDGKRFHTALQLEHGLQPCVLDTCKCCGKIEVAAQHTKKTWLVQALWEK
jgi:hypothetical protein